jgi:hypothetical protein
MIKNTLVIISLFITLIIEAQTNLFFENYNWDDTPSYKIKDTTNASIVSIKDKAVTEFNFEEGGLVEYFLEHKAVWLNSDDKIEAFNKVYLPFSNTAHLKLSKARVITREGSIVELNKDKILTAKNEETGGTYKYFAFEGITKGSIIEYFFVVRRFPKYRGNRINLQSNYLKKNVEFDLFAPKNLLFKFKTYNDTTKVQLDTLSKDKLHWTLKMKDIKALEKEESSAYNAAKKFIVYKLDKNLFNQTKDISSYSNFSQNIYSFYYEGIEDKPSKFIKKFISKATNSEALEGEALIRKLEFYIKNNIYITQGTSENLENITEIIKNNVANQSGVLRLYITLYKYLNIKHELVITCDRSEIKFDGEFEANNFLTDFLIYFNKYKTFLSPTNSNSRYGYPPSNFTDNYGLFIKEVQVGDFKTGLGKVKYIDPISADKTVDKMNLTVSFSSEDIANSNIRLEHAMSGYYGLYIHPIFHLINQENKDKIIEGFAKRLHENVVIKNKTLKNENPELFGLKPIEFIIDMASDAFTEKAGKKYLFKVGELIGHQMELYQNKKRVLPVENKFERSYLRTINVTIPKGYKIANLDDVVISNTFIENGEKILAFNSSYEIEGNSVKIVANEFYRKNIIPVKDYENYRRVINSAADFNKVVLIFEPI